MSFISAEFLLFFIIVVPIYFVIPGKWRWLYLLLASYVFYASWNASYIFLIVFSTLVDYFVAQWIDQTPREFSRRRKLLLATSLLVNLGILFTFKYFGWFTESVVELFDALNIPVSVNALNLILPVGISFYTFQSMSYTIDVYRGDVKPEKHFGYFATYISFFPQLVAGPIERAGNMLPQFHQYFEFDYDRAVSGLRLILWGVFKKVVIADRLAIYVNEVFGQPDQYDGFVLILAAIFFGFQIYCDFSGYSDIAIGTARIMGFKLMDNFRQPYWSISIRQFWRRWHISLSTWFRDYVYIPLGGNRVSLPRNLVNLMIVFVVSGLWHGAGWTFLIWGALHGLYIVAEVLFEHVRGNTQQKRNWSSVLGWFLTFSLVMFAWIFFRSPSLDSAILYIQNMFDFSNGLAGITDPYTNAFMTQRGEFFVSIILIVGLMIFEWFDARYDLLAQINFRPIWVRWGFYYVLVMLIGFSLLYNTAGQQFIYFQF